MRLNKFLAENLGVSRRQADQMIAAGRVHTNQTLAQLGARATGTISVDGKIVHIHDKIYLAMNKPVGYLCSRKQQGPAATLYSLLPQKYLALKTVGRLDKNSSGLILLTNDGDFAQKMTHPKFQKLKRYEVTLDIPLKPLHQRIITDFGVDLKDGKSQLWLIKTSNKKQWIAEMREGRNRQIRRTFKALGYKVTKLHRTQFGKYQLGKLKSGEVAPVSP
jgi:23S rRNA pseudouridine2605 synthase